MFFPNIEEAKEIAKDSSYKRIPISYEIFSDTKTSIEVLRRLRILSNHCYMLESVEDSKNKTAIFLSKESPASVIVK